MKALIGSWGKQSRKERCFLYFSVLQLPKGLLYNTGRWILWEQNISSFSFYTKQNELSRLSSLASPPAVLHKVHIIKFSIDPSFHLTTKSTFIPWPYFLVHPSDVRGDDGKEEPAFFDAVCFFLSFLGVKLFLVTGKEPAPSQPNEMVT